MVLVNEECVFSVKQLHNAANANQKEKYEADLKKEIKKLQVRIGRSDAPFISLSLYIYIYISVYLIYPSISPFFLSVILNLLHLSSFAFPSTVHFSFFLIHPLLFIPF